MTNLLLAATENWLPAAYVLNPVSSPIFTRQVPEVISIISGVLTLKVSVLGRLPPTVLRVPSGNNTECDTHFPSKNTLPFFTTLTLSNCDMTFPYFDLVGSLRSEEHT